jgi:hypothetical protein
MLDSDKAEILGSLYELFDGVLATSFGVGTGFKSSGCTGIVL